MKLIKPKYVYKNVKSADAVSLNLLELGITSVVLVVDSNIISAIQSELIYLIDIEKKNQAHLKVNQSFI